MIDPRYRHMKANFVPPNSAQSAPARPRGGLGGPPRRRGSGWDALKVLSGTLMDIDGSFGYGHRDAAMGGIQDRRAVEEQRRLKAQQDANFSKAMDNLGMSGMGGVTPEQLSFLYSAKRDGVSDARDERNFERGVVESDRSHDFRVERADRSDFESDRGYDRGVFENDRSYESGRDDAKYARMHSDRVFDLQSEAALADAAEAALPDVKGESALLKEFLGQNKGFQEIQRAYGRILETDPTNAAGQMSLIFQYMKMMDPGSTVREGEFANAQNTTGIPGQVLNAYNRARAGEFLNPTQVGEFQRQAQKLYGAAAEDFELSFGQYRSTAQQYNYDGGRTVPDLRNPEFGSNKVVNISSDEEFDALPSGSIYVGPDGVRRRKS